MQLMRLDNMSRPNTHFSHYNFQGSWTKGKLSCPGCGCRLGGFDYVTRASEPVYIVKSKVDIKTGSGSGVQIVLPGSRVLPDDSGIMDSSESGSQTQGQALCF